MVKYNTLYHGTCRAFVVLAEEKGGLFGPDGEEIYFTSNLGHAKMFAEGWNTERGRRRLEEYFKDLPTEYSKGVVLGFDSQSLGKLEKSLDAGGVIQMVRKGPIQLGIIKRSFNERKLSYIHIDNKEIEEQYGKIILMNNDRR